MEVTRENQGRCLTLSSSGAVGGTARSLHEQAFLVAHLPVRMAGQLSPAPLSLGGTSGVVHCGPLRLLAPDGRRRYTCASAGLLHLALRSLLWS